MTPFGVELRHLREAAGLSLGQLSILIHYSKGYLSKIENDLKPPSIDFARRCDAVLGSGSTLAALVPSSTTELAGAPPSAHRDVWAMRLSADGDFEFDPRPDADVPAHGAPALMCWPSPVAPVPGDDDGAVVRSYRLIFDQLRQLGQTTGPSHLVPILAPATRTLGALAKSSHSHARRDMLILASRFAEYTGWMAQEKGDERATLWWIDEAVELAKAAEDSDFLAYAYVRRALIALYHHDPSRTIELAQWAQKSPCHPRILGLAAQREAQGHAIAGDMAECLRALERAARLLARTDSAKSSAAPQLGTSAIPDPVAMSTGWCLHELGRSQEAAEVIGVELARVPRQSHRARARYGTRLALALASIRELEQASEALEGVLDGLARIDSATIRTDAGRLARTLNRWHADPTVRRIMPRLTATLRVGASASGP